MKKLILLSSIITICYSCQKQTIEPTVQNNVQQSTCGPLGDCYSGTYLFDSIKTMDPTINQTGTDTIVTNLIVKVEYKGDSLINGYTYIKYKLDSNTCNLPFILQSSINSYNSLMWLKGTTYGSGVILETKTHKIMVFWRI